MTYDPNHEEIKRLVRLEENVTGLRREIKIEFDGRDEALKELKDTTKEWKAQANEWRSTISDVGAAAAKEARQFTETQIITVKEYIDIKFRFLYAAIGASTTIIGLIIYFTQ